MRPQITSENTGNLRQPTLSSSLAHFKLRLFYHRIRIFTKRCFYYLVLECVTEAVSTEQRMRKDNSEHTERTWWEVYRFSFLLCRRGHAKCGEADTPGAYTATTDPGVPTAEPGLSPQAAS